MTPAGLIEILCEHLDRKNVVIGLGDRAYQLEDGVVGILPTGELVLLIDPEDDELKIKVTFLNN